jgi:SAM-dependent methyltransferase
MDRFSDLSGLEVLDVGCGYGVYTDDFRRAGAWVTGCDGSPAMLKRARMLYPDCSFELVDLLGPLPYDDGRFDLVFCNQVLMDLPDITGLFREFERVVKAAGTLYFAIVHPASYPGEWIKDESGVNAAKQVRDYGRVYQIEHSFCGGTSHFHRPVSYYLNLAAENGFRLVRMEEPCDPSENDAGMPLFLFAEFQKQQA